MRIIEKFKRVLHSLSCFLFPERCPFCRSLVKEGEPACDKCKKDFPINGYTYGVGGGYRCCSPLLYDGKYKRAVLRYKFRDKRQYSMKFAQLMFDQIMKSYPDFIFDCITYVPMYEEDQKERGFNQCELLANDLSKLMKIPCKTLLKKHKKTNHQHNLKTYFERKKNLKGAFSVISKEEINGKSILLIDDIVTTGSTLAECIKTLNKGNPSYIATASVLSALRIYKP